MGEDAELHGASPWLEEKLAEGRARQQLPVVGRVERGVRDGDDQDAAAGHVVEPTEDHAKGNSEHHQRGHGQQEVADRLTDLEWHVQQAEERAGDHRREQRPSIGRKPGLDNSHPCGFLPEAHDRQDR